MSFDSYANLQTEISNLLNRPDLVAKIPGFIALAEAKINRTLRVRKMIARADATINAEYFGCPADFAGPRTFSLTDKSPSTHLNWTTPDELARMKAANIIFGCRPHVYSIVGTSFQFYPAPSSDGIAAELSYWQRIPMLSDSNPINWLLSDHPDIYLYGSALPSAPYLRDDDRLSVWSSLFEAACAALTANDVTDAQAPSIQINPTYSF